jgi:hypothetical protein
MKLYKDGQEVLVDKSQLKILLEAGWSMSKETEDTIVDSASEEEVEEVKVTTVAKPKKTTRKPKKISLKE